MTEVAQSQLEMRVARLEQQVEELLAREAPAAPPRPTTAPGTQVRFSTERPAQASAGPSRWSGRPSPGPGATTASEPAFSWDSEKWLGLVGIAFVVLSFGFLLKLSFDRGWITPPVRLVAGFLTGGTLVFLGLRLEAQRRSLAQAMLGGGVALLYLSGLAGSQLYGLLPWWAALSIMTTTALLSLVLSERQASPALAVLGSAGGLAAPFLLDVAATSPGPVAAYASLVLLAAAPVQFHRGWHPLLVLLATAGALVVAGTVAATQPRTPLPAALLLIAVYWAINVAAQVLRPKLTTGRAERGEAVVTRGVLGLATAVVALGATQYFSLDQAGFGSVALMLAAATAALGYWGRDEARSVGPAADVAAVACAIGLALVAWGSAGILLVMIEVCLLLVLAKRGAPATLATIAHWMAASVVVAFLLDCQFSGLEGPLGLREGTLFRAGVLASAVAAALWADDLGPFYRGGAYLGLMALLASELAPRPHGQAMISIAWGLQGTVTLIVAQNRGSRSLQRAGLGTLGVVAAKLLLLDLESLGPTWRILLFLGFGVTLVGLGYLASRRSPGRA